jgi:c-di-AMP phosphodiesterase-like protein
MERKKQKKYILLPIVLLIYGTAVFVCFHTTMKEALDSLWLLIVYYIIVGFVGYTHYLKEKMRKRREQDQ